MDQAAAAEPASQLDLHRLFREHREHEPCRKGDIWSELGTRSELGAAGCDPVYSFFEYDDCTQILRDGQTFSSKVMGGGMSQSGAFFGETILSTDDPKHHTHRR